ncbi:SRPBCC family protein [Pelagibius sp.]|uniref:SRPBCC family protein n=1 Tax=Pelagibius sp. TaxID=1931238 RepID=UPI003B50C266
MSQAVAEDLRSVVLRYRFNASVEELFAAWTDPEMLAEWWGPEGFRSEVLVMELHPGGRFEIEMTAEDGEASRITGVYREISPPTRLVFEITEHCTKDLPPEVEPQIAPTPVTVEFISHGDQSEIVLTQDGLNPSYSELVSWGWGGAIDKLKARLG